MSDLNNIEYTRKDLVLFVANKDGGAHIDNKIDDIYMSISRNNAIGWTLKNKDGKTFQQDNPIPACIRQITDETLQTIKNEFFGYLGRNDKCYCGSGKKYKKCCLDK
jgi:hypothetical protein